MKTKPTTDEAHLPPHPPTKSKTTPPLKKPQDLNPSRYLLWYVLPLVQGFYGVFFVFNTDARRGGILCVC